MTAPGAGYRVLVVEDNPDSRATMSLLLQIWGHEVQVAEDGQVGVQKALAWKPDVAVVDIGLPLLDGLQVAQRVRAALNDRIRLIALTAYSRPEDRQQALSAGFDDFVSKPADPDQLRDLIADRVP